MIATVVSEVVFLTGATLIESSAKFGSAAGEDASYCSIMGTTKPRAIGPLVRGPMLLENLNKVEGQVFVYESLDGEKESKLFC